MQITLAVEDNLSRAVARRLVREYLPLAKISGEFVAGGSIGSRIPGLNQRALHVGPVLALADLDRPMDCPAALVGQYSRGLTVSPRMLIRVAVLEVESWILADRTGIAGWMGISANAIARNPENLIDPKRSLVELANRSRNRLLKEAIAPRNVLGTNRTGPGYNETVSEFVSQFWNPEAARRNAPSLDRAISRIAEMGTLAP